MRVGHDERVQLGQCVFPGNSVGFQTVLLLELLDRLLAFGSVDPVGSPLSEGHRQFHAQVAQGVLQLRDPRAAGAARQGGGIVRPVLQLLVFAKSA